MNTIELTGCSPIPLSSYLKALGILRVLTQQNPETTIKGFWHNNAFSILSIYDRTTLIEFFQTQYSPTPIVAPWNGGSGFYPKDNSAALTAIESSKASRFLNYRDTIDLAKKVILNLDLKEKPEKEEKENLLLQCRNSFSDIALEWLDSAFVLLEEGAKYPPLLGTGGNDGRLEFTNNFMQRLVELFDMEKGVSKSTSNKLLENALFGTSIKGLADNPIGQFFPAASGGANASTGFDAKSLMNPWDFVLALEGAILFAVAAVKRLESDVRGQLAYPFCVFASGAGYGSASNSDEKDTRNEIWMPLWNNPAHLGEIRNLFGEGRAWVGQRPAKNGVDFAQAIASLGVDRGISEFVRYGFHVRNGLAYFATPLQRLCVHRNAVIADLLSPYDGWISQFLSRAKNDNTPGSIRRSANRLENAIFAQTASAQENNPDIAQEILVALGECERVLSIRYQWCSDNYIRPIPPLHSGWIKATDNNSAEFRLAAALASLGVWFKNDYYPIRRYLEPVEIFHGRNGWVAWDDSSKNDVVGKENNIATVLCSIMQRAVYLAKSAGMTSWPEYAKTTAWPCDVAAFIEGRIDDRLLAELIWGLCLVDFTQNLSTSETMPQRPSPEIINDMPPSFYAQLKLCFTGLLPEVPIEPIIFNLAANGDGLRASKQALRRLHGSSIPVTHVEISVRGESAKRSAAALLFPLWELQFEKVGKIVAHDFLKRKNNQTNQVT